VKINVTPLIKQEVIMDVPRMEKEEFKSRLNDPKVKIIDVRRKREKEKILNARPEDPDNPDSWMDQYSKDDTILLYCS
jgi:hypothetical protein